LLWLCDGRCSKSQLEKPWYQANDTAENNEVARKAYESLMTITLRKPDSPEYLNFSRQVKKRAKKQSGSEVYDDDEGVRRRIYSHSLCRELLLQAVYVIRRSSMKKKISHRQLGLLRGSLSPLRPFESATQLS